MKKCSYCGQEYPEDVTVCSIDGHPMVGGRSPTASAQDDGGSPVADAGRDAAQRSAAERDMLVGGLWFGGGILVTVLTYSAASGGGSYVVAWGAILFGGIQFFRGLTAK